MFVSRAAESSALLTLCFDLFSQYNLRAYEEACSFRVLLRSMYMPDSMDGLSLRREKLIQKPRHYVEKKDGVEESDLLFCLPQSM